MDGYELPWGGVSARPALRVSRRVKGLLGCYDNSFVETFLGFCRKVAFSRVWEPVSR